jgi:glycosyltransferase involved in cell wall biosynthesis
MSNETNAVSMRNLRGEATTPGAAVAAATVGQASDSESMSEVDSALTVTIFMATLNEIDGLREIFPRIDPEWYDEMIVIDGGSTDGTVEFLKERGITVLPEERKGVVNAYNLGFARSSGDIFIPFQPDGNCIPELIPVLIAEARKGYDIVFVSRYLPPAKSVDDGLITGFGNRMFRYIINILFRCHCTDPLGGYRAYRRGSVLKMRLNTQPDESALRYRFDLLNTWEVGGVIRAAKLKLNTKEIPGDEPARIGGVSTISIIWNGSMVVAQILYELVTGQRPFR